MNNKGVKILLVDDHPLYIDGVKMILCNMQGITSVQTAESVKKALEIINNQFLDLVITDIHMPEVSGTELVKIIKKNYPELKVLVLSSYNYHSIVMEIFKSEAEGYILKSADQNELKRVVTKILNGGIYYSQDIISVISSNYTDNSISKQNQFAQIDLTPREIEILKLISMEYTSNEIAEKLFISPLTVETHRKHLLKKTNSRSVVGLVKYAINYHII
ncbi:MAG TPA: response regulator transcription factor [Bacteroidales bacterium]|nr:response regulator transcription factor [Bacteroidales bacterium]